MKKAFLILVLFLLHMPNGICAPEIIIEAKQAESAVIQLRGTLELKTFYGPPNFGEEPDTDAKETYYFLNLDRPMDVRETSGKAFRHVKSLQIVYADGRITSIAGIDTTKKVFVTGKLFLAETGHHHSDVLILAEKISNVSK